MSAKSITIVSNILASIFGWGGFGMGISSVTTNSWVHGVSNIYSYGLWKVCNRTTGVAICSDRTPVEPYLHAVRAFLILLVIFSFFSCMANVVSQWKYKKEVREGSGGIWLIAAFFGVIAGSVYSGVEGPTINGTTLKYGYGFIACWVATGCLFLANLANQISARYMKEAYDDI